jgi:hypothetical protein
MATTLQPAVIADARRRRRRRRILAVGAVAVGLAIGGYGLFGRGGGTSQPSASRAVHHAARPQLPVPNAAGGVTMELWTLFASPDRSEITSPFGRSIALFERPRRSTDIVPVGVLAAPFPKALTFGQWLARFHAQEGKPLFARSREVDSFDESIYFIPTDRGKVCYATTGGSMGCMDGLTREGIYWRLGSGSANSGLSIFGLATSRVARIDLLYGQTTKRADLADGAFTVERPFTFHRPLPKSFGRLVVHYRDGRPPATVVLK